MRCQPCREALSARLDGEDPGVADALVDRHLAGCAACRAYGESSRSVRRAFAVRPADPVPDLTGPILAAALARSTVPGAAQGASRLVPGPPNRSTGSHWSRWALLAVALIQLAVAVPSMVLGHDADASVHAARELGAWDLALAAALLLVVLRPTRAVGLVPFAAVLSLAMVVAAAIDVITGGVAMIAESHHLLELVGLCLLWVTARRPPDHRSVLAGFHRPRPSLVA